jgi:hypothetical protein
VSAKAIYCLDTSAFLEGADIRPYPIAHFKTLWEKLDGLAAKGRLRSVEEVLVELEKKADPVSEWAGDHSSVFIPSDAKLQRAFQTVMATPGSSTSVAVAAVPAVGVALARITEGSVVVSQEHRASKRLTIPRCATSTGRVRDPDRGGPPRKMGLLTGGPSASASACSTFDAVKRSHPAPRSGQTAALRLGRCSGGIVARQFLDDLLPSGFQARLLTACAAVPELPR